MQIQNACRQLWQDNGPQFWAVHHSQSRVLWRQLVKRLTADTSREGRKGIESEAGAETVLSRQFLCIFSCNGWLLQEI